MNENGFDIAIKVRVDGAPSLVIEIDDPKLVAELGYKHKTAIPHNYDSQGKYKSFDKAVVNAAEKFRKGEMR